MRTKIFKRGQFQGRLIAGERRPLKRRDFFRIMGIVSGATLSACKANDADRKCLPYLVPPEEGLAPGEPRYINTTCLECPAHCGIAVKLRDERPIKLEGNPAHPINNGALCLRGQASLSRLYHPKRQLIQQPLVKKTDGTYRPLSWPEALDLLRIALKTAKNKGLNNVFLRSRTTGTLNYLIDDFCKTLEIQRLKELEIYNHDTIKQANRRVFGLPALPYYHIDRCDTLLTLGVDLLETFLSPVEWSRQYAEAQKRNDFTWHHVEPYLTLTGASANRRHLINPDSEAYLLAFLIHTLKLPNALPGDLLAKIPAYSLEKVAEITGLAKEALQSMGQSLAKAKQPLIICGGAAAGTANGSIAATYTALLQWGLGMIGQTVNFPNAFNYDHVGNLEDFKAFIDTCREGKTGVALFSQVHGFTGFPGWPADIKNARFKVALADMPGPLTEICDLVLPLSHFLESWGDVEPRRGIRCLVQPAMNPLRNTKSEGDILLALLDREQTYRDYLADHWHGFGEDWPTKGFKTTAMEPQTVHLLKEVEPAGPVMPRREDCLYIVPSLRTFDGRGKSIDLLEEIPEPATAISYGKWLAISTSAAREKHLSNGDEVEIETPAGKLKTPVTVLPGLPPGIMTMTIDSLIEALFNRTNESNGTFSFYFPGVRWGKTGETVQLAILSGGKEARNRGILPADKHTDKHTDEHTGEQTDEHTVNKYHTLYPPHQHKDYRWGMAIDLDLCTGCSACVAACYIENNIPVVGQAEHIRGREMSWLRIEAYYDNPRRPEFIPVLCQQCDNAPCEAVCPVYATYHNPEGLNAQVYNRCVGTRYCANNCPYKVRRFNWFNRVNSADRLPLYAVTNPELTVRPKGVMEKCTFCVQRIRMAGDKAKDEKRKIRDGDVIPACAQTCPTGAITFGNLRDPGSRVSRLIKSRGVYRILEQLGTEPAVYYVKKAGHNLLI